MTIGERIAKYRREKGLTQEGLAKLLDVTNQAVSKWESDQCCPDILLLPKLADIFAISLDELFERENPATVTVGKLPWKDDDTLRVVLYRGHRLLKNSSQGGKFEFHYDGEAQNIISAISVTCGDVRGDVDAGISVVVTTQCLYDSANLQVYQVGTKLLELGVIQGRDMTSEAAMTKLMWAIGQGMDPMQIRQLFATSLAGEISAE